MTSSPSPSDAVDVLAVEDPVAAFVQAHDSGRDVLLRTSGSSGAPRVVRRTTASWVDSFPHVERLASFGATSRAFVPASLTGTMNLFACVHARFVGAPVVEVATDATHWFLTPTALRGLLDGGSAREGVVAVVAGDRLDVALHDRATAAGLLVHHYYGAAELSFVAWGPHEDALRPFPDVEIDVRDGEIRVRSPWVSRGYATGTGGWRQDPDGFATVGDRGALVDGALRVAGRDDVVLTGGATVRVADVEGSLRADATGALAVVGVPHPTLGAVVAIALEDAQDLAVLRAAARTRLDAVARPRLWFHVAPFPRTDSGKTDRATLASMLAALPPSVRRLT